MDETEKPKRKYTRRNFTGIRKMDEVINDAVEATADAVLEEDDDAYEEVSLDAVDVLFGVEPTSNSLKAKIIQKFGLNKTMVLKPWKGIDHWECSNPKCRWTTFDKKRAKRHACE